jgi:hypothetical protein
MKRLSLIALLLALGSNFACQNKSDKSVENAQNVARSSFASAPQSI